MQDTQQFRAARLAGGFKCREVAQLAGLDPSSVAHYEVGHGKPSNQTQARWREALRKLLSQRAATIADSLAQL